ncbi:MAG: hypothetical protein IT405_02060 [Candidatus Yanofskybacteria bacterium]|nr:hypothetical protein [Candidatus Yanofskybacteria bacterium]
MLQGMLAAALGAATGTVLALMMGALWPLGTLLGGLVGYLSYNTREVAEATRRALSEVPWRVFARRWPALLWSVLAFTCISQTVAVLVWPFMHEIGVQTPGVIWRILVVATLFGPLPGFFGGVAAMIDPDPTSVWSSTKLYRWMAINLNLVVLAFYWAPVLLFRTAKWLFGVLQLGILAMRICAMMAPHILRDVYSEKRLIAGLSAFQGAVIGYLAHDWVFAGVAGLSFFVLQVSFIHRRLAPQQGW